MSVILDALRRARGSPAGMAPGSRPSPSVPAGLGLTPHAAPVRTRRQWTPWLGAAAVALVGAWAALQYFERSGISTSQPPSAVVVPPAPQVAPPAPDTGTTVGLEADTTVNPEPRTVNGERRTRNREPRTLNGEPRTPNQEPRTANTNPEHEPGTPNQEPGTSHFTLALRFQNLGDFERAREHYLAALAENEFNVEARNNLALLYHERGMTNEAVDELRRVIRIAPEYIKARGNLGAVLTAAGRLAEARAELRAALAIEPRNVDLLVNMALVEKADRQSEAAMELLLRAVGMAPRHAVAHYNLAVLYEERAALALAYDHYSAFLRYAGPEHGALLTDVQQRVRLIEPKLRARS